MHPISCSGRRRYTDRSLWIALVLTSLSNVAWAEGTDHSSHSLILHPPGSSPAQRFALDPAQTQSSSQPFPPHSLIKKPTSPSPPLTPTGALLPSVSPPLEAPISSIIQPAPMGSIPAGDMRPSPDIPMGRSAAPHASASVSPRTESSRLPGALQRLFRDNPAFTKLLQIAPPVASTPPPPQPPPSTVPPSVSPINKVTLTWIANKESDLAGYKVYVGTSSGRYDFPGSPFIISKTTTYIVRNLQQNTTYFFAISAYDLAGNESPLSAEVSKSVF